MLNLEELQAKRRHHWRQESGRRIETSADAIPFINEIGVVTLFGASPEFPSLYQAHMGDPNPPISAKWDSPSGYVYTWRWELGRPHVAFYGTVVAKKPTWVAFDRLPCVLAAMMDRRNPAEAYAAGELSKNAFDLTKAFEGTEGVLSTKELRARAGLERATYLKAVEELDSRLWLAKRFFDEGSGDEMSHALISRHYPDAHQEAIAMTPLDGLVKLLEGYLTTSTYIESKVVGRHLRVAPPLMASAFGRLAETGRGRVEGSIFVSRDEESA